MLFDDFREVLTLHMKKEDEYPHRVDGLLGIIMPVRECYEQLGRLIKYYDRTMPAWAHLIVVDNCNAEPLNIQPNFNAKIVKSLDTRP